MSLKAGGLTLNHEAGTSLRCVVLDIEGTTTPISFVTDVLFPYAGDNVRMHLEETFFRVDTREDIKLLRSQVSADNPNEFKKEARKDEVINALVTNVEAMIKADKKITSLKQLQGHIWRTGFEKNEIKGVVYDDVPEALERWHASGIKVGSTCVNVNPSIWKYINRVRFGGDYFRKARKWTAA
ncbi:probable bifunctional methylthioribulose-1-phosphate dehydratase/enolase-phosphatase E1 [Tanacetum coccineum]